MCIAIIKEIIFKYYKKLSKMEGEVLLQKTVLKHLELDVKKNRKRCETFSAMTLTIKTMMRAMIINPDIIFFHPGTHYSKSSDKVYPLEILSLNGGLTLPKERIDKFDGTIKEFKYIINFLRPYIHKLWDEEEDIASIGKGYLKGQEFLEKYVYIKDFELLFLNMMTKEDSLLLLQKRIVDKLRKDEEKMKCKIKPCAEMYFLISETLKNFQEELKSSIEN